MKKIFLLIAICNMPHIAYAVENPFYITVGAGWTIPSQKANVRDNSSYVVYGPTAAPSGESYFNLPNVDWRFKYNSGILLNVAMGYHILDSWRTDIEFVYQNFKRHIYGTYGWAEFDALSTNIVDSLNNIEMTPSTNHVNVYSLMTNGYHDFHNNTKWTPHIGLGFGVAWIKSSSTDAYGSFTTPLNATATTLQKSPVFAGTAFAWQLKAGVSYDLNRYGLVILQYRLFATTPFIANPSTITTNPQIPGSTRVFTISQHRVQGLVTNSIEMLFKFKFG